MPVVGHRIPALFADAAIDGAWRENKDRTHIKSYSDRVNPGEVDSFTLRTAPALSSFNVRTALKNPKM
jgi:hypothetical protein